MSASPSQKNNPPAREKILFAAFDLFHEKGIQATSVDDILKHSGTGKSQFYHYFKSKEGIVHSLLQQMHQRLKTDTTINPDIESWSDLERWLRTPGEMQESCSCQRGCPIGTIAANLAPKDELIRQDIQLIFETMKIKPKVFFATQKAQRKLRKETDPDSLATFCVSLIQGTALLSKVERSTTPFNSGIDHALIYLKSFKID
ncbi:MAG: TetR family transcriptional regulator [Micavibrio sp.]|nr:MAG: TetR family transcriptional regulator [Micavibrio sp.]